MQFEGSANAAEKSGGGGGGGEGVPSWPCVSHYWAGMSSRPTGDLQCGGH